ncbi:ATP-binding protein [Microbispora sp. RL4-1S]|uniref:ATP-binding protein n=1 Tax=Microbispora oryzae TaxID=2806554 RepID=A0A940WJD7_9ACTN|nr:ATP-binding protein [Microbispora oryzae]MBP2704347.1 ATP-binding protein [Microbispora oryzae]
MGTQITQETLRFEHLRGLVEGKIPEAADLDYKGQLYGNSDSAKRDLCTDVAAQANTQGGLVIVGIDEDSQARAAATPGVSISDAETLRMRQIPASGIAPFPAPDVIPVEDPERPGIGCYVIAVPRSPRFPHGITINDGFRWPRRNGASITYMSESELSSAYRSRFSLVNDQSVRAQ